jgi:integrase
VDHCAAGGTIGRPAKPALERRGGTWHYRFTLRGRRFRGSTGERDRGRAESFLAAQWHEAHRALHIPVASSGLRLDLAAIAGLWLARLEETADERSAGYPKRATLDTTYILEHFRLPGDVTDPAWQDALRALHTGGLSWRTLQHTTVTLRHLVRFAASIGAIASAPELRPPANRLVAKEAAPRRALSEGERDRVLRAMWANGDERPARAWATMAYTGLRHGELRRLTLRWLDLTASLIRIPATAAKSGEEELIPLHPKARQAIRGEARSRGVRDPDVPVFGGFDLRKAWKRALARSKVDKYGTTAHHTARHTYGTLVAQLARGDVTAVQAAGRWRSLAMVARYVHADAARARAAVRRL